MALSSFSQSMLTNTLLPHKLSINRLPLKFPSSNSNPNPNGGVRCTSLNDKTLITPLLAVAAPSSSNKFLCRATAQLPAPAGQESTKTYAEAFAIGRHIRMSADKARRVVDVIRGRTYEDSIMMLELMPYRACESIIKIVFSAGANASNNLGLSKGTLVISKAEVNEGKTLKRVRFGARGRVHPFKRRTCHISITVKGLASESVVEAKSA
ncbi:hypothetical protein RIF29_08270 [Crotalaria pallida]|uniref:Large ribosomal subunit protein uL22c n=1 Tax=Crotalaria pallida TaxID=3830 RepID=A0AAN9PCN2_CROPI